MLVQKTQSGVSRQPRRSLRLAIRMEVAENRLELPAHVHGASVAALGRVDAPVREGSGHADLPARKIKVGPLERERFSEA